MGHLNCNTNLLQITRDNCGSVQPTEKMPRTDALVFGDQRPVAVDSRLDELEMGPWTGLSADQISLRFPSSGVFGERRLTRWHLLVSRE
jgi:broad specificity phosphatase PhoE